MVSCNICNIFAKIQEMTAHNLAFKKFELDKLNKNYKFNPHYRLKMLYDLDFLTESEFSKFFNLKYRDPFFFGLSEDVEGKTRVPIKSEMEQEINKCYFVLMNEAALMECRESKKRQALKEKNANKDKFSLYLKQDFGSVGRRGFNSAMYKRKIHVIKKEQSKKQFLNTSEGFNLNKRKVDKIEIEAKEFDQKRNASAERRVKTDISAHNNRLESVIDENEEQYASDKFEIVSSSQSKKDEQERKERERKERLEKERKAKELREKKETEERDRKVREAKEKKEKEKKEREEKEKKEKEEKEREEREEKEEKEEKEREEKEKKEREEKEKKEKKEKEAKEKKEREEKEKKEREEKEKKEKEEKEKKEKKEKEEKEKKEKEKKEKEEKEKKEKEEKHVNVDYVMEDLNDNGIDDALEKNDMIKHDMNNLNYNRNQENDLEDSISVSPEKQKVQHRETPKSGLSKNNEEGLVKHDMDNLNYNRNLENDLDDSMSQVKDTSHKKNDSKNQEEALIKHDMNNLEYDRNQENDLDASVSIATHSAKKPSNSRMNHQRTNFSKVVSSVGEGGELVQFDLDNLKGLYTNDSNDLEASEDEKETEDKIKFEIYRGDIDDIDAAIELFADDLEEEKRNILFVYNEVQDLLKGVNPVVIMGKKGAKIVTFAFGNYESGINDSFRFRIRAIGCAKSINFENTVENIISFVEINFPHEELIISLFYEKKDSKFIMNSAIKGIFSDKLKFNWLNVENFLKDGEPVRYLRMSRKSGGTYRENIKNNMTNSLSVSLKATLALNKKAKGSKTELTSRTALILAANCTDVKFEGSLDKLPHDTIKVTR